MTEIMKHITRAHRSGQLILAVHNAAIKYWHSDSRATLKPNPNPNKM